MFSTITKPEMFALVMTPKENFLAYSKQFIVFIIELVLGNGVMVVIHSAERAPVTSEWIYGIT